MTSSAAGRSLEIYYVDGRPDGVLVAEMFNWTGHVLMIPRIQLSGALSSFPEASYTGVYLLLGEREGRSLAYIGESEDVGVRIKTHDVGKDWWTNVVLVTTAGNKLNKAHVRYLENRLIEEACEVKRVDLENIKHKNSPGLNRSDKDKMEVFLDNLLVVLPALRIDMFVQNVRPALGAVASPPSLASEAPVTFRLVSAKHGLNASATLNNGEFVVAAGSQARLSWKGKEAVTSGYAQLHEDLKRSGVLKEEGECCVFTKNYAFGSSSAAAAVVYGRQTQGTVAWKTADGLTYKDWEMRQLTASHAPTISGSV